MKRNIIIFVSLVLACFIVGCGRKPDCIMLENAAPETSAMSFYCFDGENTTIKWLFDEAEEQQIIDEINKLKTKSVDDTRIAEMTIPCYGIEIVDKEGYEIWLTYSNGLWLLKDGTVFEADYDFKSLFDRLSGNDSDITEGGFFMLNSAILGQYDQRYYAKSEALSSTKDGITLTVTAIEGSIISIKIQNDSDTEFFYGEDFSLQKEIDSVWYQIPVRLSNYAFNSIGMTLPAHESTEVKCDLTMYGDLEDGHYRIEKEQLVADFYIEE